MKKTTSWGKVATWYDTLVEGDNSYQNTVILPNLLRVVSPDKGKEILDLACGQGFFSAAFLKAGSRVTGVDISPELVEIAKMGNKDGLFKVSSAEKLPFPPGKFDVAVCVLALQNIKDMQKVISEVARVLKDKGRFVFVLNHPAFRIPKESDWGFDAETGKQYRKVATYMSERTFDIVMNPGKKGSAQTISFHRPLQSYVKSLSKAGFAVTKLEEWISDRKSQKGPRQSAEDKARKEIPLFMLVEAVKI